MSAEVKISTRVPKTMTVDANDFNEHLIVPSNRRYIDANTRLESLRLAYQTAKDIKYFKSAFDYKMSNADFEADLQKVLELANFNLKYIMGE